MSATWNPGEWVPGEQASDEPAPAEQAAAEPASSAAGGAFTLEDLIAPGEAVIGVDIGGTKTHAVLFSAAGPRVSARRSTITSGPEGIISTLNLVVEHLCSRPQARDLRIRGVGVGIPGMVSSRAGTVSHGVNVGLPGADIPLAMLAHKELGMPVVLSNDVTAATLGSARLMGVGTDVALISLGTGVATGMILDGVTRYGTLGSAGEIGHIPYVADGIECPCGQRGCLELYASGSALRRMWPVTGVEPAENLLATAAGGDAHARQVLSVWMGAVAHAVTIVGLTLDVATILIGGGVAQAGAPLLQALRAELTRSARDSAFLAQMDLAGRVALVPAELEVAPLGAALAALTAPA